MNALALSIKRDFRLFLAQLRLSFISSLQYRADYLLMVLSVAISAIVEISLWRLVMKSRGQVQGFGIEELLIYLVIANVTHMMCVNWDNVLSFSEEVRTGKISRHLVKPMSLFYVASGDWLAGKLPVILGTIPVFMILAHVSPLVFHPSLLNIAMYISFMVVSLWLAAEIYFIIILSAFWISENQGIAIAYNVLGWAFVGEAFPLSFYPRWLKDLLDATPFPYLVYYPVMALMGRLAVSYFLLKLVCAILIGFSLSFLRKTVWRLAEQRLQTVGG